MHRSKIQVSEKRLLANRINAQKSTGPRTIEGKYKVSANAIIHGMSAEKHLVVGEDIKEFEDLKEMNLQIYKPIDDYSHLLFEQIFSCLWRLRRIPVVEAAILSNEMLEFDADTYKPKCSDKFYHADFRRNKKRQIKRNHQYLGIAFVRDSNGSNALLKLSVMDARIFNKFCMLEEKYAAYMETLAEKEEEVYEKVHTSL